MNDPFSMLNEEDRIIHSTRFRYKRTSGKLDNDTLSTRLLCFMRQNFPILITIAIIVFMIINFHRNKTDIERYYKPEPSREQVVRNFLNHLYDTNFTRARPTWLVDSFIQIPMELDFFNPQLGLCFQLHDESHYQYPNPVHTSYEDFQKQVYMDTVITKLCEENNVKLYIIPYNIDIGDICDFILEKLRMN